MHLVEKRVRAVGVCVPLFSLRTKNGFGIGEFLDLKLLVDWAIQSGISLIQLLPVNDTSVNLSWLDSYPYSSLSAFALHPIYVHLDNLNAQDIPGDLDYEKVYFAKMRALKELYVEKGEKYLSSFDFKQFYLENRHWLDPYALFCTLRDRFHTADFYQWPGYESMTLERVSELINEDSPFYSEAQFFSMVQYILAQQFKESVNYALERGVLFKGDFAIGVHRHSVDSWIHSELFQLETSIGAPPDFYNSNGQNWGFPSYNWQRMEKDGYNWLCQRLVQLSKYFQLVRLDHILGYFRLWEIPSHAISGLMGRFNPCIPIHRSELGGLGINDIERLTTPFTEDAEIKELLKIYKTEKEVIQHVRDETLKKKLIEALGNVILLCDENDRSSFHFRFNMQQTNSFAHLDPEIKGTLQLLYEDYFFHRQDDLWKQEALKKLPILQHASSMLVCAEDLGFVPRCVKEVLEAIGLLELYIQRMPKKADQEFGLPWEYSYLSVCAPSNHDTSVLRAYLQEDPERTKRYLDKVLKIQADPMNINSEVCEKVLQQHLDSPSMLAIFILQDVLAMKPSYCKKDPHEERINNPENPFHYWRFRFPFFLEDLLQDQEFSSKILAMVSRSSRLLNFKD